MMSDRPRFDTVDAYITSAAPEVSPILEEIRTTIKRAVPDATEAISYQMPAFKLKSVFIYFAAFKHHVGVYPPVAGDEALSAELEPYRGPKGNLKFSLSEPIPYELIGRVAQALAQEYTR
jgi:uncharacterized protein YdhG (YjbR/CyaY superfamily)